MWMLQVFVLLCSLGALLPETAYSAENKQYFIPLPININVADELTLSRALVGVGPKRAAAIVEYRKQNGPFENPEDLVGVKGVGEGTLRKNLGRISIE